MQSPSLITTSLPSELVGAASSLPVIPWEAINGYSNFDRLVQFFIINYKLVLLVRMYVLVSNQLLKCLFLTQVNYFAMKLKTKDQC